jgi:hypothetical protein
VTRRHDTWATMDAPIGLELYYGGAWHDITADLSDGGVQITRGRSAEGQEIDPAQMSCLLSNATGTYSPRHPSSALYGLVGRNTPIRFWVEAGQVRARQASTSDSWSCPDSAGVSVTGDIDLRVDLDLDSWRPPNSVYIGVVKNLSYGLYLGSDGRVVITWSSDGVNMLTMWSSQALMGGTVGRKAVRATLDVNNGASGRTARFYYSDTISGTWTQLGSDVVAAGTTSIVNNTAALTTGTSSAAGVTSVYGMQVRNGIGGTVVASPDFTAQVSGATSFTDGQGNTWTPSGTATVSSRHYRFTGEVTTWPTRWTIRGNPYVPIECSGVKRRLGQGVAPVVSPMRRAVLADVTGLVGYWPLEDAAGSTSLRSGIGGTPAGVSGAPALSSYEGFVASDPLPILGAGRIVCTLPAHTASGFSQVRWLGMVQAGTTDGLILARIAYTGGTLGRIDVRYDTASGGGFTLIGYNTAGSSVGSVGLVGMDNDLLRLSVELDQNGANIDAGLVSYEVGASVGFSSTGTLTGVTIGRAVQVTINPGNSAFTDCSVGHVTVETAITSLFDMSVSMLTGWLGEQADVRVARLGGENGVTVAVIGAGGDAVPLGVQRRAALLELLQDASDADQGMLYEPRGSGGLAYRTRESLCSQPEGVSITYSDNLLLPFEPIDDDQRTRNKVTVTRDGGASATVEITEGPLNTSDPTDDPDGVGVYEETATLSLAADSQPANHASWRAHVGTVNEARWPTIGINLAHPVFLANPALTRQILDLDLGDRIVVTDLPSWLPPVDVDQIVQGYTEEITPTDYRLTLNCVPASPYRVGVWGDPEFRWSGAGTVLAEDLTTTETIVDITPPAGTLWTVADGSYQLLVGGEVVTCTAVTGSGPGQTMTWARSVNGVVKTHLTGAPVDLAEPRYWSL